ncbi:hypothetical protein [Aquiflexum gelatinilyticum]|uniref:Uncharacterized protein n=1 Tax=Aquiflexum gelatinilyticum TaxID=2961943 RepID=A0A9X2T344_9BACT|nr:hypothetical protein [Aquiflexum gelatinilyticum]MCR9017316.1 hypothetical protein [Aquiflexum gelatinilyticum]
MKQIDKISHLVTTLYFAIALVIFLLFDNIKGILKIEELTPTLVVNFLLIGLLLFLISWGISTMAKNNLEAELSKKETEKNELKAKLYDFEQGIKLKNIEKKLDSIEEEREASVLRKRQNFK